MTTPVKEYSLNVIVPEETQRARPTVLVCVPVHHGPYDLVVRVHSGRYDSRDHRLKSRDLPSAFNDPPPASEWSEDCRTITMYPFKAWDGPVPEGTCDTYFGVAALSFLAVDPTIATSASSRPPNQTASDGRLSTNVGTPGVNNEGMYMGEVGSVQNEGEYKESSAEAYTTSSLASDDMEMVPGTPGEDDEAEEAWMMRSYRKSVARLAQEVVLR
ncbi:hypothetical protein NLI96_g12563 [Meripilus lineatus]|uniref:Uncharacterized protein n=1 Tax=Meripilus lineatus TaxID=2056292 RepID=A0AAD5YCA5_9APHY|nr:hypothetical protein NLI96_g12563 [Physisporinus lineatus]